MLLAAALAALLLAPQDSVRVQASLTANRVAAGASTVLAITVETTGDTPDDVPVPVLPAGLDLGPVSDFSQLQVAFPGGRRRITRREIVLLAGAPGIYRIPPVTVTVGGRGYRTAPLQLIVGAAGSQAGRAGSAAAVRLRVMATPDTAWVGQQVLYRVEAVFPEGLRLRQARGPSFQPPAPTGFWTYDLPEPVVVSLRMVAGEPAEVQDFRLVLFPLVEGTHAIPPARLQYELRQGLVFTPEVRTLTTEAVAVHVRPLPPGAPAAFAGAVGRYSVAAALSPERTTAGEPVTLRLTVEGAGNLKALTRPELPAIEGLAVFPGTERTEIAFADGTVSGRKTFEWTLLAEAGGQFLVPALEYAWFDPYQGRYESVRTAPLTVAVAGAGARPAEPGGLAPLRQESRVPPFSWATSSAFAAAQLLPPLALLVLWGGLRRRRRLAGRRAVDAGSELRRAGELLREPRACLEHLAAWLRKQAPSPEVSALHDRVRNRLYAPATPSRAECAELLDAATRLVGRRPGAGVNVRGLAAPVLLLWLLVAPRGSESGPFNRGVDAYQRGAYAEAVSAFTTHVAAAPLDAAGWYDLGNASARAGQPGRAAWAWLRTLQLAPRDAWARQNLRAAGGSDAALAFAPRVPLSRGELAALAALLWWLAAALAGLAMARRRRAPALLSAVALVLSLPLAALLLVGALRTPRAVTLEAAPLRAAPAARAEPLEDLPSGAPLILLEHRNGWVLARAHDLREGWVEDGVLGRL